MEPIFKYIFALIVGAMFILFFVRFAMQYTKSEEKLEASQFVASFDDYLTELSVTSGEMFKEEDFGMPTEIVFDKGQIKSGRGVPRKSEKIIFSPRILKGKKVLIWTKKWSFPYPVDNFFYMTNENFKYILVFDDSTKKFVEELVEDIHKGFKVEAYDKNMLSRSLDTIKKSYAGFSKVRFVFFCEPGELKNKLLKMKNADIVEIKIGNIEDKLSTGTVKFADGEAAYLGEPMIVGAIFSEDFANYEYNLENLALVRLAEVTEVLEKKADFMSSLPQCNYGLAKDALFNYRRNADAKDIEKIAQSANNLISINKELFGAECPDIF